MLEAYAVGVKLEMTSNVAGILDNLIGSIEKFDRLVSASSTSLGRMARNLRELKGSSGAIAELEKVGSALGRADASSAAMSRSMRTNAEYAAQTARAMEAAAAAAGKVAGARINAPGGGSGGHSSRFSEHNLMMGGIAGGMVGGALTEALRHTMTPAIDVTRTRDVLAADMRLTPDQVDAALARAKEVNKLAPGSTTGENLASMLDLKTIFGDLTEAQHLLPEFARMTTLFQALDRKHGGSGDQAFAAGKALEVMAGMVDETTDASGHTVRSIDPELGMRRLKLMERVAVATNMRVLPSDYLAFAKQSRVAGMTLTDEFTYEKLPAMMAVVGGSRMGTALMSMAQVYKGGKLTEKSMDALIEIGLASAGGVTREKDKRTGKMKSVVHPEAIYDLDLMGHDTQLYLEAAQKRMEAKGIHGSEAQIEALMRASQRATIAGVFADLLKDMPAILKEQMNIRNTRPDMAEHMTAVDPAAKIVQFEAAMTNLATALGMAVMGDAMGVLDRVTRGLTALGDAVEAHPTVARVLVDVGAGIAGLATSLGLLSTAIFVFGPAFKLLGIGGGGAAAGAAATGGREDCLAQRHAPPWAPERPLLVLA